MHVFVRLMALGVALLGAPFLLGVINRTKAVFAGRRGAPWCQAYYDLAKLLRKGAVYSQTTSWIFRAAPAVGLAAVGTALLLVPVPGIGAPVGFAGDFLLLAYCLGLMRFFTVSAALDTGSAFEGMGASREVLFAAVAEPALLVGLAALARAGGSLSLSGIFTALTTSGWTTAAPALILVLSALLVVFLAENSRIPVDDPNTHLELTMIHEVMILDYSGPDLAFILYAAALKLWILGALIVNLAISALHVGGGVALVAFLPGMLVLAVVVGIIESIVARLSLLRVPQLLAGAVALSVLAFMLIARLAS